MQEVNLGRKSLFVLCTPLLCHYMLGLRISIGEGHQYVACRLYRTVLLIYTLVLILYIITSFVALTAYKSQKNSHAYAYVSVSLSHYILITPLKSVGVVYVQLIILFGSYNPNHAECGTAGF